MKTLYLYLVIICCCSSAVAQDLNARVSVVAPKVQTTNKRVFQSLETAMKDFLNGRKWLNDQLLPQERLECSFVLNVTSWDGNSTFSGELQVQSSRPVYNSAYTTTLLNINDKDIDFTYNEGQTIDYSDQSFTSNLSSIMAYYAYIIAGFDYDSFSRFGGSPYFSLAQKVVINAQTASFKGWKAFDSNTNRYWLSENVNNKAYADLRGVIYDYHRNGLDVMADNAAKGRRVIAAQLPILANVDRTRLGAMLPLIFYSAKSDELVSIFSGADPQERLQAMNTLLQADPGNGMKYQVLQKGN
ncbi:MAG: type IX secretion system protein PorD [Mucilaginibacter sp.]